jgi:vitamin B12 transporter
MQKNTLASLISLALVSPLFITSVNAAENVLLDDVVVTATRTPQPREAVIADVSVIEAEEIQRAGQSTLVELLQTQPGIEITNNGGAGSVSGIFMRGTNTSQVVVLVDGMRIGSATAGITALENLPTSQIDRIEILRGPATSLYGQDAIGGVIQIFTKKGADGAPKFNANLGYGSYGTVLADAGVSGNVANTRFALNVSSLNTDGFSAIKTTNKDYNDRDAYRNLAFTGNISHEIVTGHELGFQFLHSEGDLHFDNTCPKLDMDFNCVTDNFDTRSKATQYSYAFFTNNKFTDIWSSKLRIGKGVDENRTFGEFSVAGGVFYKTKQQQFNWQNDIKLPVGTLTLVYDHLNQNVDSNDVDFILKKRTNDGYVASYLLNQDAHSLQLSARHDRNSQFGSENTGGIGYGYSFTPEWRATASYGTAFRAPTFNDLYFPDFGGLPQSNPNLSPEKSENIESSLRYHNANTSASITVFKNSIRNLIALDANFIPFNLNKANIQGLTLAASKSWDNLNLQGSVDIQSANDDETGKLLRRRANRHASLNASYNLGDWRFGAETIASSLRYNDAANTQKLAGYALLNATVDYMVNKDWSVQARANNILDKNYALALEGIEAYNTPGANLFVNIRYQP